MNVNLLMGELKSVLRNKAWDEWPKEWDRQNDPSRGGKQRLRYEIKAKLTKRRQSQLPRFLDVQYN